MDDLTDLMAGIAVAIDGFRDLQGKVKLEIENLDGKPWYIWKSHGAKVMDMIAKSGTVIIRFFAKQKFTKYITCWEEFHPGDIHLSLAEVVKWRSVISGFGGH